MSKRQAQQTDREEQFPIEFPKANLQTNMLP